MDNVWGYIIAFVIIVKISESWGGKTKNPPEMAKSNVVFDDPEPQIFNPLPAALEAFSTDYLQPVSEELPTLSDNILKINKNTEALKSYSTLLENHLYSAQAAAGQAVIKFEEDYSMAIWQKEQLRKWALKVKKALSSLQDLHLHVNVHKGGHTPFNISLPPRISYETPAQIEKKFPLLPANTGVALSKMFNPGSGITGRQAMFAVAVTTAIGLIRAQSNLSKMKRSLEDARGAVTNYCIQLRTTVTTLSKAHTQLVESSKNFKKIEKKIKKILDEVTVLGPFSKMEEINDPLVREKIEILYFFAIDASNTNV